MVKKPQKVFDGVFLVYKKLATKNLCLGQKVYGEELISIKEVEYRVWNPFRSKIASAIKNGLKELPIKKKSTVLYLGCAEGTTVSHVSDIVGEKGMVFGLDISAKVMNKFLYLCNSRENLCPILADAAKPETYKKDLTGFRIDCLFQDISQKEQVKIFLKNAQMHLKKRGQGLLTIKARSISSFGNPEKIFKEEISKLTGMFKINQIVTLSPFQKDHVLIYCEKK